MPELPDWAKLIVDIGAFGVLAILCYVVIQTVVKSILPWLERKDDRHAETIKGITVEFREALDRQANQFQLALNHNTSAMNNLADEINQVRGAVEQLGDRLDKHEARRS